MESPLQVKLAGFNVDVDGINEAKKLLEGKNLSEGDRETALDILNNLTPETIAAAYARISRDSRPLPELRADARKDVEGSRKSCNVINFTMGHKSIAEHAIFNFDIMGLSRRAVEEVEAKRLQSYLEKSQRYIKMDGDFVIPVEIQGTPFEGKFVELIETQNNFYDNALPILIDYQYKKHPDLAEKARKNKEKGILDKDNKEKNKLDGLAKEDARYALAQATQAQFGMTASARNIETLITKLRSSNVGELKELGGKIQDEIEGVAPSVIKYTEPVDYFAKTRGEMREFVYGLIDKHHIKEDNKIERVRLFSSLERDDSIIAGLIFSSSHLSYEQSLALIDDMSVEEREDLLEVADKYQEKHDPKLREYELGDRVAEFIISSSGFAQLKRHRMNTLIPQQYLVWLDHTTPESIIQTGLNDELSEIIRESNGLYGDLIKERFPIMVAEYALTNANRRRVLFDANNRQAYAFCAERENLAAQWDIRAIANEYHEEIQKESSLTTAKLCGKDRFYDNK